MKPTTLDHIRSLRAQRLGADRWTRVEIDAKISILAAQWRAERHAAVLAARLRAAAAKTTQQA